MKQDPREALDQARKLTQGKGIMGWLTRLFMGKNTMAQFDASLNQAQGYMDQADVQARLRQTGAEGSAQVLSIVDTGAMVNFNPVVDLSLQVQPSFGGPAFPVQVRTPVSKIAVPRVGDTISVKYNPQNPAELVIL